MLYYSLNDPSTRVTFKEATIRGQAPDKGLYFPVSIPTLSTDLLHNIHSLSREEIAFQVIAPYIGDTLTEDRGIVYDEIPRFPPEVFAHLSADHRACYLTGGDFFEFEAVTGEEHA